MSGPLCQAFEAGAQATWRNDIARRIWEALSPSTLIVRTQGVFYDRVGDHALDEHDCSHWCQGSAAWNEHVAALLTSITAKLRGAI